jgi:hypothetical protein
MQMTRGTVESLSVSGVVVRDHDVVVGGFIDAISEAAGTKLDGIIGHNFLSQFRVTVDYPRGFVTFAA